MAPIKPPNFRKSIFSYELQSALNELTNPKTTLLQFQVGTSITPMMRFLRSGRGPLNIQLRDIDFTDDEATRLTLAVLAFSPYALSSQTALEEYRENHGDEAAEFIVEKFNPQWDEAKQVWRLSARRIEMILVDLITNDKALTLSTWVAIMSNAPIIPDVTPSSDWDGYLIQPEWGTLLYSVLQKSLRTRLVSAIKSFAANRDYYQLLGSVTIPFPRMSKVLGNFIVNAFLPKPEFLKGGTFASLPILPADIPLLIEMVSGLSPDSHNGRNAGLTLIAALRVLFRRSNLNELFRDDEGNVLAVVTDMKELPKSDVIQVFEPDILDNAVAFHKLTWGSVSPDGTLGEVIIHTYHAILPNGINVISIPVYGG